MILVLFLMILPALVWIIGIICGIIKVIKDNATNARKRRLEAFEAHNAYMEEENKKARERDYLTAYIANLEDLQRIIETKEHDEKQLRQLITLDKQIHAARLKLEKLE